MPTPIVIDISHHQPNPIDFGKVRAAGIVGVIHKATEGTGYKDPDYIARKKAAKAAGLLWGAYHFATNATVRDQLDKFLAHADPDGETLLALDYEDYAAKQMSFKQMLSFLEQAEARLGHRLVLYSGNTVKQAAGTAVYPYLASHRLWVASYTKTAKVQASWNDRGWWLWQYSDKGAVAGIKGKIDVNAYAGSDLAGEWVTGSVSTPAPKPVPPVIVAAILPSVDEVKELQRLLIKAGYSVGPAGVDGDLGDDTKGALRALLENRKMPSMPKLLDKSYVRGVIAMLDIPFLPTIQSPQMPSGGAAGFPESETAGDPEKGSGGRVGLWLGILTALGVTGAAVAYFAGWLG